MQVSAVDQLSVNTQQPSISPVAPLCFLLFLDVLVAFCEEMKGVWPSRFLSSRCESTHILQLNPHASRTTILWGKLLNFSKSPKKKYNEFAWQTQLCEWVCLKWFRKIETVIKNGKHLMMISVTYRLFELSQWCVEPLAEASPPCPNSTQLLLTPDPNIYHSHL